MIDAGTYDELDRYALEKMPAEERSAFEKRIAADEELREELEWLAAATLAMNSSGKSILQKQIAQIAATVPVSALENYTPALNKKGFLKKWGWAIAGIIAVAAGIAVWWFVIHKTPATENREDRGETKDMIAPADSVKTKQQMESLMNPDFPPAVADSCADEILFGEDSVPLHSVKQEGRAKPPAESRSAEASDTAKGIITASAASQAYAWSVNEKKPMLDISYRSQKGNSPTYLLGEKLVLYSNYKNSSGLSFYEDENSVIMIDSVGNTYVLKRIPKEQKLVRQQSAFK